MNRLTRIAILLFLATLTPVYAAQSRVLFNGGITTDEREAAPQNGTKLEFFVTTGSFLSNIAVTVKDSGGNAVVTTTTAGPWLILDLTPGTYTVQATRSNGDAQGGMIEVSGDGEKYSFMFPDS